MHATTVAVDLAKERFELAFADAQYRIVERKRLSRRAFADTLDNRGPLRAAMEACGNAHYWACRFIAPGRTSHLLTSGIASA